MTSEHEVQLLLAESGISSLEVLGNLELSDIDAMFPQVPQDVKERILSLHALGKVRAAREVRLVSQCGLRTLPDPRCHSDSIQCDVSSALAKKARTAASRVAAPLKNRSAVPSLPVDAPFPLPEDQLSKKRHVMAEKLWSLFLQLGEKGTRWNHKHMQLSSMSDSVRSLYVDEWANTNLVARHTKTLETWITFALENGFDWTQPDEVASRLFLKSFRSQGPTVPKRHFDSLRWLEINVGMQFGTSAIVVRKQASAPAGHSPTQAPPTRIQFWFSVEQWVRSDNVFVSAIGIFWFLLICSVCRPRHLQRSKLQVAHNRIEGCAKKGKSLPPRPFWWSCPLIGISGFSVQRSLESFMQISRAASEERSFVLPSFLPLGSDYNTATSFGDEPMSLSRCQSITQKLIEGLGLVHLVDGHLRGLYGPRHVLPTLAQKCRFNDSERLLVGGWSNKHASAKIAMPNRYSAAHLSAQQDLKTELIRKARDAWNSFLGVAPKEDPSWEDLFNYWPAATAARVEAESIASLDFQPSMAPQCALNREHVLAQAGASVEEAVSSASSSDSSVGSGSERSLDLTPRQQTQQEQLDIEEALAAIDWELARGTKGCLHHRTINGLACKRHLHGPEIGSGLRAAELTGHVWSPRCFNSLPEIAKSWIREGSLN